MDIVEIRVRKMFAGPGNVAYVAEATVENDEGETFYVTMQDYDGKEYTVSVKSIYDFMVNDNGDPADEFIEEYRSMANTKTSVYAEVFSKLKSAVDLLG